MPKKKHTFIDLFAGIGGSHTTGKVIKIDKIL